VGRILVALRNQPSSGATRTLPPFSAAGGSTAIISSGAQIRML
jgi:hypothetical protein